MFSSRNSEYDDFQYILHVCHVCQPNQNKHGPLFYHTGILFTMVGSSSHLSPHNQSQAMGSHHIALNRAIESKHTTPATRIEGTKKKKRAADRKQFVADSPLSLQQ